MVLNTFRREAKKCLLSISNYEYANIVLTDLKSIIRLKICPLQMPRMRRQPEFAFLESQKAATDHLSSFDAAKRLEKSLFSTEGNLGDLGGTSTTLLTPYSCTGRKCPFCSYVTKKTTNLKRHIHARHTGEKPYACKLCPYRCVTKDSMKMHLRKHTGEKPYACFICPYRATNKKSVDYHISSRHKSLLSWSLCFNFVYSGGYLSLNCCGVLISC